MAVIVTFTLVVTTGGAVYVAATLLAVCNVIEPQFPAPHNNDQSTPKLFGSPVTLAVTCVVLPAARGDAGNPVNVTEIEL